MRMWLAKKGGDLWDAGILSSLLKWAGVGLLDGGKGERYQRLGTGALVALTVKGLTGKADISPPASCPHRPDYFWTPWNYAQKIFGTFDYLRNLGDLRNIFAWLWLCREVWNNAYNHTGLQKQEMWAPSCRNVDYSGHCFCAPLDSKDKSSTAFIEHQLPLSDSLNSCVELQTLTLQEYAPAIEGQSRDRLPEPQLVPTVKPSWMTSCKLLNFNKMEIGKSSLWWWFRRWNLYRSQCQVSQGLSGCELAPWARRLKSPFNVSSTRLIASLCWWEMSPPSLRRLPLRFRSLTLVPSWIHYTTQSHFQYFFFLCLFSVSLIWDSQKTSAHNIGSRIFVWLFLWLVGLVWFFLFALLLSSSWSSSTLWNC